LNLFFFGGEFFFDVIVEGPGEGRPIAREVRAAVLLRNVVRVAIHALLIGVVPLHRHFHLRIAVAGLEPQHRGMHRSLAAIQVRDEGLEAAFVLENLRLLVALVDQFDAHAGVEERQFAQTFRERVVVEGDVGENLRARLEAQRRAFLIGITDGRERRLRLSQPIFLPMQLAVAPDQQLQIIRERIDDRDAHAVQAA
jgi:hypothetical protein